MIKTILHIKNMCCDRCIEEVRKILLLEGYAPVSIAIGEVVIAGSILDKDMYRITKTLLAKGFAIADKLHEKIITKIHALLCIYIRDMDEKDLRKQKLSVYLAEKMHKSYYHLSHIFSVYTGITIENYFIRLKIEKAKELLTQDEFNITEIAWQLGYGSQQTFATQFKKETGKTPGQYKSHPTPAREHLDKLLPQHFKQKSYLNERKDH